MDSRELARGSGVSRPDEAALGAVPEPAPDENSGLHEIKALASTTRRRISQKITSDKEGEESLLVGASSGSFRAAALPDPARENATAPARERDARPVARPAFELDRHPTSHRSSSAPFWVLGGVATAAAAAAVAVFVFGVGRENASKQAPATDVVARTETTPASPAADRGLLPGGGDMKFAEPPPPPAAEPMAEVPAASAPVAGGAAAVTPDETASHGDAEGGLAKGRAGSRSEPARESRDQKESEKDKEKKVLPANKQGGKNDGKDLDDVLDQVAGKVDKPAQVDEEGPKKPTKKELDRGDVSRAMGAVRASVMRCRDKEQFEGTVTVKFQVSPSGQVTSAEATGSKAGSPTGACVAAAVKKAKFPPFDGAPTSFTYPFLLAE